jgi:hypothetical protein
MGHDGNNNDERGKRVRAFSQPNLGISSSTELSIPIFTYLFYKPDQFHMSPRYPGTVRKGFTLAVVCWHRF